MAQSGEKRVCAECRVVPCYCAVDTEDWDDEQDYAHEEDYDEVLADIAEHFNRVDAHKKGVNHG